MKAKKEKSVREIICEKNFSDYNYLHNLKNQLDKFFDNLGRVEQTTNKNSVKSDLKDIGCISADLVKITNNLIESL